MFRCEEAFFSSGDAIRPNERPAGSSAAKSAGPEPGSRTGRVPLGPTTESARS